MDSKREADYVSEMMLLVDELDYCNRHMEEAYQKSINPAFSKKQKEFFRNRAWEHLYGSLEAFSGIREMPAIAILTCINILEHDLDDIGFPKTEDECRMYEATDAMKSHLQKIFEEVR